MGRGIRIVTTAAVAAGLLVAVPGVASAGGPGEWTQLSNSPADRGFPQIGNIDVPTVARYGDGLQVVWKSLTSSSKSSYFGAEVNQLGQTTTASTEVLPGWDALHPSPRLISVGGQRMLVFSGLRTTAPSDEYNKGAVFYATGTSATAWTLGAGSMSHTQSAYAASGFDAVNVSDTPVWLGNTASASGLTWHVGISPTIPAPDGSDQTYPISTCCAYMAAGARDAVTGNTFGAFSSQSNVATEKGIWVGQILPASAGWQVAPGSATVHEGATVTDTPNQRIAMAARVGGGVYLAYGVGYPSVTGINLWSVGSAEWLTVPQSEDARNVSLAAAPDGSLWVAWKVGNTGQLRAVHTDTQVTRFGAVRTINAPADYGTLWNTALDATGPVSLVVTAENAERAINVFHQQVTEVLMVSTNKASVPRGGKFKATVEIATGPVSGATVKVFGDTYTTNTNGKAKITVPTGISTGKKKVKASKSPYGNAKTTIKVTN